MAGHKLVDWAGVEEAYRTAKDAVRKIARDFGVTESAIRDRAKRHRWERGAPAQSAQPEPRTCAPAQTESSDDSLTDKQRQFVREYLVDLNATAAARRAGYAEGSADVEGSRLLRNAKVSAAVQRAMDERSNRTEVTVDRVVEELALAAFRDPADVVSSGDIRGPADIAKLPVHVRRTIEGWSWDKAGNFVLKFVPKTPALDLLGKHLGMFVDRTEITGEAGAPIVLFHLPDNGRD